MKKHFFLYLLLIGVHSQLLSNNGDVPSSYYQTNPTLGKKIGSAVTIDGNPAEWTKEMLIVQGVANDDARSFRGPHEAPVYDLYQLYACWDDSNLYLMWQITNVSDIVCLEQGYPNSDNGKPWNGDIPFQLAFDIDPQKGTDGLLSGQTAQGTKDAHIWGVFTMFGNKEVDKILMFSSKPKVGQPGIFSLNESGAFDYKNVKLFGEAGIEYMWGDHCFSTEIFGINKNQHTGYLTSNLSDESLYVDFISKGHNKAMETVYEMKIPLTALGIDVSYLESTGIGVMLISTFGQSGINSLPYDPATFDNASELYSADESTSKEKEDVDVFSASFARIGAGGDVVISRPKLTISPAGGKYIGGTSVSMNAEGDKNPIRIYYTLDGTTPTTTSALYSSPVQIIQNNTTLKAVAVDADGVSSPMVSYSYITEESPTPAGITVMLKKPDDWSSVYLWAWTGTNNNLFSAWPGQSLTEIQDSWYAYTFDTVISSVNVVFNNNGTPQTVDITDVTTNTCYVKDGMQNGKMTVVATDCPDFTAVGILKVQSQIVVFPNPAIDFIAIKNIGKDRYSYVVSTIQGAVVQKGELSDTDSRIDISQLYRGLYIIRLEGRGDVMLSGKFVKQ
ncbi:MAG: chitobiase/beta-hexosaminidase C-terminal domain-containing protein [Paludibacteraceae bacterium]